MELLSKVVAAVLSFAALVLLGASLSAYPIMLALGSAHHEISPKIPALGFWATLIISWGLGSVSALVRGTGATKEKSK